MRTKAILGGVLVIVVLAIAGYIWLGHPGQLPVFQPNDAKSPVTSETTHPLQNTPEPNLETQARLGEFVNSGLETPPGQNQAEIIKNLGQPSKSVVKEVVNQYNPQQKDHLCTLMYPGITIGIYQIAADGKEFVISTEVTGERIPVKWGLKIGATRAAVIQVLGEPAEKTENTFRYDSDRSTVSFTFEDNKITKIEWASFLD